MDPFKGVLCFDFETSSACDIKAGAWAYSEHPTTIVYVACMAYAERAGRYDHREWWPGGQLDAEVVDFIRAGGILVAHNVGFERSIWANLLLEQGWPGTDAGQWCDTQKLGLAVNQPLALEGLARALGCPVQKDKEGAKLMKRMASPVADGEGGWVYDRDPDHLMRLHQYCRDDVAATLDCYFRLPALSVREALVARVDQRINERGVYLDQDFAAKCLGVTAARSAELADEAFAATGGWLSNSTAAPALKAWLKSQGVVLPKVVRKNVRGEHKASESVAKAVVVELLGDPDLPAEVRQVLENRVEANKVTSLAKLKRVPTMVGTDGRLRHALHFHGAHTGRWTSSGLQVHNLPKDNMEPGERALVRLVLSCGDLDGLKLATERPLDAVSQSLRSVIAAPPGRELVAGDFSGIEARVIAWLAGQDDILAEFAAGTDVYAYTAARIGSTSRQLGKVCVLALGYGMGPLKFASTAAAAGIHLENKQARAIQQFWRQTNHSIVEFWARLEEAARDAIDNPGTAFQVGLVYVMVKGDCLLLRLPSGRALRYWRPRIVPAVKEVKTINEDGEVVTVTMHVEEVRFFTMGKDKKSMAPESTYGGKLAENVTQGAARDLLADALVRVDGVEPYEVVMHVHDSIAAEVPEGGGSVDEFCALMVDSPRWADGLPVAVDGYRDVRFRG